MQASASTDAQWRLHFFSKNNFNFCPDLSFNATIKAFALIVLLQINN